MKKILLLIATALTASFLFPSAAQAVAPVNKSLFGGVAIKGYDPVAYFTQKKPVKGSKDHTTKWNGATWRFSSAANRDLFKASPEKYAPQFGGYCAWAVSQNSTANIDPSQWTVVNGKLYLNYDSSVQKKWLANRDDFITKAEKNWPGLVDKK